MEIKAKTKNLTKLDVLNMGSGSRSFKDTVEGVPLPIRSAAVVTDVDNKGVERDFAYVFTKDGDVFAGNSAAIVRAVTNYISLTEEENEDLNYSAVIRSGTTKDGKQFLTMNFLSE